MYVLSYCTYVRLHTFVTIGVNNYMHPQYAYNVTFQYKNHKFDGYNNNYKLSKGPRITNNIKIPVHVAIYTL